MEEREGRPPELTASEVCAALGITHRRLDYWVTTRDVPGVVQVNRVTGERATGPGTSRRFTAEAVEFLGRIRDALEEARQLGRGATR